MAAVGGEEDGGRGADPADQEIGTGVDLEVEGAQIVLRGDMGAEEVGSEIAARGRGGGGEGGWIRGGGGGGSEGRGIRNGLPKISEEGKGTERVDSEPGAIPSQISRGGDRGRLGMVLDRPDSERGRRSVCLSGNRVLPRILPRMYESFFNRYRGEVKGNDESRMTVYLLKNSSRLFTMMRGSRGSWEMMIPAIHIVPFLVRFAPLECVYSLRIDTTNHKLVLYVFI